MFRGVSRENGDKFGVTSYWTDISNMGEEEMNNRFFPTGSECSIFNEFRRFKNSGENGLRMFLSRVPSETKILKRRFMALVVRQPGANGRP